MKRLILLLVFVFTCPLIIFGCSSEQTFTNEYFIEIEYDAETQTAVASEKVIYYNQSDLSLDYICFHLYPNAFREDAVKKVVTTANQNEAYPNGESWGGIFIDEVKNEEYALDFEITGEDENILKIYLSEDLEPLKNIEINIDFSLILPNINHRFGYGDKTVNFGNFYPIACVFENGDFVQDLYVSNGDPFYSDCSKYDVQVTYDKKFVLASTGEQYEDIENDGKVTTKIKAENVRDFCFILSENFDIIETKTGNTLVKYYFYDDENPQNSLQTAVKSIETFNSCFGNYPYSQYSVVECNFVYGGMEFPQLVMISDSLTTKEDFQYVIIHETAHQWWYGIVGNNQYENAWIDEGLAEYSTALFYEKNQEYGVSYKNMIRSAQRNYDIFVDVFSEIYGDVDTSMNRKICDFNTEPEYVNCTYTKGLLMFNDIRENVGENKFQKILSSIVSDKKYKNLSYAEFLKIFSKFGGEKISAIIKVYVE